MTQCNSLNVKLSNSQLDKLKSAIKNGTDVILKLSSNMIGNSDDEGNFPHKLLLTNRQVANLCKVFANLTSTDIDTFGASLLGYMLAGRGVIRAGEGTIRAGYGSKKLLLPTH